MIGKIGFTLLLLGCAGIDSLNMAVPAIMALAGIALISIEYLKEKSFAPNRPK